MMLDGMPPLFRDFVANTRVLLAMFVACAVDFCGAIAARRCTAAAHFLCSLIFDRRGHVLFALLRGHVAFE